MSEGACLASDADASDYPICSLIGAVSNHHCKDFAEAPAQRLGVLMRAERRRPSRIAFSDGDSSWLPLLAP